MLAQLGVVRDSAQQDLRLEGAIDEELFHKLEFALGQGLQGLDELVRQVRYLRWDFRLRKLVF